MMSPEEKKLAIKWIQKSFLPAKTVEKDPYCIKHDFEFLTDIYMAKEEMIQILSELGFDFNLINTRNGVYKLFKIKGTKFYKKLRYARFYDDQNKTKIQKLLKEWNDSAN